MPLQKYVILSWSFNKCLQWDSQSNVSLRFYVFLAVPYLEMATKSPGSTVNKSKRNRKTKKEAPRINWKQGERKRENKFFLRKHWLGMESHKSCHRASPLTLQPRRSKSHNTVFRASVRCHSWCRGRTVIHLSLHVVALCSVLCTHRRSAFSNSGIREASKHTRAAMQVQVDKHVMWN